MCTFSAHDRRGWAEAVGVTVDDADGVAKFLADHPGLCVLRPGARDERPLRRSVEGYADYEAPPGPWWTWDAP